MPNVSEKVTLLGKGLYKTFPDEITIKTMPTVSELDYVASEDFDNVMLTKILPECIEETGLNFDELLQYDYQWICRCLRFLNYGPYQNVNAIYCKECGPQYGDYQINLTSIECNPLPEGFINNIKISKDEFIDFNQDVTIKLLTMREVLNFEKDSAFKKKDGTVNRRLARTCYMIKSIGTETNLTPLDVKLKIEKEMSPADFKILEEVIEESSDYGLRAGGKCQCPKCKGEGTYIAFQDDRFFRPTLGNLRKWKDDKRQRRSEDAARNTAANV